MADSRSWPGNVIGLNTCIHQHLEGGFCAKCQARRDAIAAGRCANCLKRPATETWVSECGVLGFVHGFGEQWCRHCVLTAQIEHAEKMAAMLPDLKQQLAAEKTNG